MPINELGYEENLWTPPEAPESPWQTPSGNVWEWTPEQRERDRQEGLGRAARDYGIQGAASRMFGGPDNIPESYQKQVGGVGLGVGKWDWHLTNNGWKFMQEPPKPGRSPESMGLAPERTAFIQGDRQPWDTARSQAKLGPAYNQSFGAGLDPGTNKLWDWGSFTQHIANQGWKIVDLQKGTPASNAAQEIPGRVTVGREVDGEFGDFASISVQTDPFTGKLEPVGMTNVTGEDRYSWQPLRPGPPSTEKRGAYLNKFPEAWRNPSFRMPSYQWEGLDTTQKKAIIEWLADNDIDPADWIYATTSGTPPPARWKV